MSTSFARLKRRAVAHWVSVSRIDRPTWYVIGLSAALFVGFSVYMSLLYVGFRLTGTDFGSYVHMFATTVDGVGFLQHGKYRVSHPGGSYWGAHFSLTLLVFLIPYALVQSPLTLLVMKAFVLAASIPALWILAREHLDNDRVAGLVVVSYAFNPFLWSAWAFDFQEQILIPILVFGAYYLYVHRRYAAFLLTVTLILLTNEFTVTLVGGFVLALGVVAWRGGRLKTEVPVLAAALVATVLAHVLAGLVMAEFSVASGIPTRNLVGPVRPFVTGPRIGTAELVSVLLQHPELILDSLAVDIDRKVLYLVIFFVPVLFLPLTDEVAAGALLPFIGFAWLLGGKSSYYTFAAHYPLYILPFLYIGTVRILGRLPLPTLTRRQFTQLLVVLVLINAVGGLTIEGGNLRPLPIAADHSTLEAALADIPEDASLLTQNDIYPHVATRPRATFVGSAGLYAAYEAKHGPATPTYILYDTSLPYYRQITRAFGPRLGSEYGLYKLQDSVHVYKRGYVGLPTRITDDGPANLRFDATTLRTSTGMVEHGKIVGKGGPEERNIWFGPYTNLPAGTYNATYRVFVTNTERTDDPVLHLNVGVDNNGGTVAHELVPATDGWTDVTLTFTLDEPTSGIEFRGAQAGARGTVRLDSVTVVRVGEPGILDDSPEITALFDKDPRLVQHTPLPAAQNNSTSTGDSPAGNESTTAAATDRGADGNAEADEKTTTSVSNEAVIGPTSGRHVLAPHAPLGVIHQ